VRGRARRAVAPRAASGADDFWAAEVARAARLAALCGVSFTASTSQDRRGIAGIQAALEAVRAVPPGASDARGVYQLASVAAVGPDECVRPIAARVYTSGALAAAAVLLDSAATLAPFALYASRASVSRKFARAPGELEALAEHEEALAGEFARYHAQVLVSLRNAYGRRRKGAAAEYPRLMPAVAALAGSLPASDTESSSEESASEDGQGQIERVAGCLARLGLDQASAARYAEQHARGVADKGLRNLERMIGWDGNFNNPRLASSAFLPVDSPRKGEAMWVARAAGLPGHARFGQRPYTMTYLRVAKLVPDGSKYGGVSYLTAFLTVWGAAGEDGASLSGDLYLVADASARPPVGRWAEHFVHKVLASAPSRGVPTLFLEACSKEMYRHGVLRPLLASRVDVVMMEPRAKDVAVQQGLRAVLATAVHPTAPRAWLAQYVANPGAGVASATAQFRACLPRAFDFLKAARRVERALSAASPLLDEDTPEAVRRGGLSPLPLGVAWQQLRSPARPASPPRAPLEAESSPPSVAATPLGGVASDAAESDDGAVHLVLSDDSDDHEEAAAAATAAPGSARSLADLSTRSAFTGVESMLSTGLRRSVLDTALRKVAVGLGHGWVDLDEVSAGAGGVTEAAGAPERVAAIGFRPGGIGHYFAVCVCARARRVFLFDSLGWTGDNEHGEVLAVARAKYPRLAEAMQQSQEAWLGEGVQKDGWSCGLWALLACLVFLAHGEDFLRRLVDGDDQARLLAVAVLVEGLASTEGTDLALKRARRKLAGATSRGSGSSRSVGRSVGRSV